jgi:hypothetical protein
MSALLPRLPFCNYFLLPILHESKYCLGWLACALSRQEYDHMAHFLPQGSIRPLCWVEVTWYYDFRSWTRTLKIVCL